MSSGVSSDVSPHQKELLSQLRARLTARRERAARRSQFLDSLEQDVKDTTQDEVLPPRQPSPDQDDVWNIKPENVTLLEAAYPHALVQRFLAGIVRERVAVLGRVQARRYCEFHVQVRHEQLPAVKACRQVIAMIGHHDWLVDLRPQGMEEDAAEDMEHYKDASLAWAGVLRSPEGLAQDGQCAEAVAETAKQVERSADRAAKAEDVIRDLGAARGRYFEKEEDMRNLQVRQLSSPMGGMGLQTRVG